MRDLLKGDIKEAYRQSKIYGALGGLSEAHYLSGALRYWALHNKLPEAEYDHIQRNFFEDGTWAGQSSLQRLADRGYAPAMLDAARRFLTGDGVGKNRGAAYYWLKRAQFAGADTASIMETPHERLFLDMGGLEWHSLSFNILWFGYKEIKTWFSKAEKN